jgi:hypothetical protein
MGWSPSMMQDYGLQGCRHTFEDVGEVRRCRAQ